MQGYITDEKGEYVKAAVVRLYKKCGDAKGQDPIDETDGITYAETDGEGRFLIRDIDPEEIYFIEVHIERPVTEQAVVEAESACVEAEQACEGEGPECDEDDRIEEKDIIDSLAAKTLAESTSREKVCINCCCSYTSAVDLKSKPYLARTNLW